MNHVPLNLSAIAPFNWEDTQDMIRLARQQDVGAIIAKLEKWIQLMGLEEALEDIIFPLLRLIGELWHQAGMSLRAVLLQRVGWQSIYLGPNVSFEMMKLALRRKHAQLVLLACNLDPGEKILRSQLRNATRQLQPSCTAMAGEPGFKPIRLTHNIVCFTQV
ncbi:MAG: hypothetical protein KC588_07395 [Nitrospira sp.]|nr:hypothetical protein [Nitrospira sp.]